MHYAFLFFICGEPNMMYRTPLPTAIACLLVSGCGTLPERYIPQAVGPKNDAVVDSGLRLEIRAAEDQAPIGKQILFHVTFANDGDIPFTLPREPEVLFLWIYSDGIRDNYLRDVPQARFYHAEEVTQLQPGEHITRNVSIETDYFDRAGITEFRAMTHFAANTNPGFAQFWDGTSLSNSYGILVAKDGDHIGRKDAPTLASLTR
jgi:hypothetical protein